MHLPDNTLLQGGKYKITRFIASGGFGCTYEGVHTMMDTKVAIKEFFPKAFCDRDETTSHVTIGTRGNRELVARLRKKFQEEAIAVFRMAHENIVRVLDVFEENGTTYYVMDYIDGKSLHDIGKTRGALPEHEAVGYIRQVADALRYVHSLNRLHLDIKPANIMVDKSGRAVLIDFGASKHYDEESGENTSTLMGVNTKGYAPIEQSTQGFTTFSPATDIYALGATLYKLLTGVTPPDANLLLAEEEDLVPLPTSVSGPTRRAVGEAMQLRRKKRPQSIDDFLALLNSQVGKADPVAPVDDEVTVIDVAVQNTDARTEESGYADPQAIIDSGAGDLQGCDILGDDLRESEISDVAEQEYLVDLGLPSGLRWASCNLGASKPSEYGDRYAWGEASSKSTFTPKNSETYNKGYSLFKINGNGWLESNGYIDADGNLSAANDAAHMTGGAPLRMPTVDEIKELVDMCTWRWTKEDNVAGCRVTGPNCKSIFLPAAGYQDGMDVIDEGDKGYYWSSTPSNDPLYAAILYFVDSIHSWDYNYRYQGQAIRPVANIK